MQFLSLLKKVRANVTGNSFAGPLFWMIYMPLFACSVVHEMVRDTIGTGAPRAWDGTGHYAVAQIYDKSIFPDTFGWITSFFAGMPFPNFYPPLFFWIVSLLHHTQLLSFPTAFKLMVLAPILLMPGLIWILAWVVSKRNYHIAFWASFLSLFALIDPRFGGHFVWASGLDYFSTFAIGMYTQPLGFVLLIIWYLTYLHAGKKFWRFILASVLLALAVLANYLNGLTSTLFIAATLVWDGFQYFKAAGDPVLRREARQAFISHAVSPFISLGLTLFWLVPMFGAYRYFVTRPYTDVVFTTSMMILYAASVIGFLCWLRRPTYAMWPYLSVCSVLLAILVFAKAISPAWYPLQANRLSPTLNFLLSVPAGYCVATILSTIKGLVFRSVPQLSLAAGRLKPYAVGLFVSLLLLMGYNISQSAEMKVLARELKTLSFYPRAEVVASVTTVTQADRPYKYDTSLVRHKTPALVTGDEILEQYGREHVKDDLLSANAAAHIEKILSFARAHREGRYLVEFADAYDPQVVAYDSRALNSYLGAQGNESLIVVFREASPSSIFMYPQVNALSFNHDSFGLSSLLNDDLDFSEQPLERHLTRARMLGAKYLVIHSPKLKERLSLEASIGARHEFADWTVFELKEGPPPQIQLLPYLPALLVTDFTLKGRHSNESNYVRLVEEQFVDGWFDVRLVRAPETKLDKLGSITELQKFGAIILDSYQCWRCELVYRQLHEFAQHRPVILMQSDDPLFERIRSSMHEFPFARVIERTNEGRGVWLDTEWPKHRYGSNSIRRQWSEIRKILDLYKVPTHPASIGGEIKQFEITINYDINSGGASQGPLPVLISSTFHPNWQSANGERIYVASPTFMLTFVREPTQLYFARSRLDFTGLAASAVVVAGLLGMIAWHYRRVALPQKYDRRKEAQRAQTIT